MMAAVTQDRLTRQELGWLLAQEARGAARALREGVVQLKVPAPAVDLRDSMAPVETSLDALEDAVSMLSELHQGSRVRRGRIDLAALLCEVAPRARVALEPGAGTEVFGEESDLRRMLQMLMTQTAPNAAVESIDSEVSIKREGDWIRISVELGPDVSSNTEVERRWLSRMAVRHGGRVELEGRVQAILLPADGATDQREVAQLRKELEQAQQLGEAYARELAAAFTVDAPTPSVAEPASTARLDLLVGVSRELGRVLGALESSLRSDATTVAAALGSESEAAQNLQRRVTTLSELGAELGRVADFAASGSGSADLAAVAREAVALAEVRAARHGVSVTLEVAPATVAASEALVTLLARALVDHAIGATPRGGKVTVRVAAPGVLAVEDGGPVVPAASRDALLRGDVDPSSLGRPAGISLIIGHAAAGRAGASLELGEGDGGFLVRAKF